MTEEYTEKIKKEIQEEQDLDVTGELFENLFVDRDEEEEKDRGLDILFNSEDIRKVSDIEANNVKDVTVMLTLADYLDKVDVESSLLRNFCDHFLVLNLSKDRKSRIEIVDIYKTTILGENMQMLGSYGYEEQPNFFSRMRQKFSGG